MTNSPAFIHSPAQRSTSRTEPLEQRTIADCRTLRQELQRVREVNQSLESSPSSETFVRELAADPGKLASFP